MIFTFKWEDGAQSGKVLALKPPEGKKEVWDRSPGLAGDQVPVLLLIGDKSVTFSESGCVCVCRGGTRDGGE